MKPDPSNGHLTHNDLLKAMISQDDIAREQADHLKSCPSCRQQLERIDRRYRRLGKLAAQLSPKPTGSIRIPGRVSGSRRKGRRSLWAVGLTAAVILLFLTVWPHPPKNNHHVSVNPSADPIGISTDRTAISDQELLKEVDALVEDALPETVQQLAVLTVPLLDEDEINWVVPPLQDDGDVL